MSNRSKQTLLTQTFKRKIIKIGAIITVMILAYVYGSFNPNTFTREKIELQEHRRGVAKAQELGFHEPEFVYNSPETFIDAVYKCVEYINYTTMPELRVPSGLIVAMAGIESGWGTSRFAIDGNNLFGIRTWDPDVPQLKPLDVPNADFGVRVFKTKCDSVQNTFDILNNHPAYKDFRHERDSQFHNNDRDYKQLVPLIAPWSTNEKYSAIILDTITNRNLP